MKNKNVCQTLHSGIISFLLYQKMSYIYLTCNIISQNSALIKLKHLESSASQNSDQSICVLSKIIQCKYPEFSLHNDKESLIANVQLVAGTGLDETRKDTSIQTAGLQTTTV